MISSPRSSSPREGKRSICAFFFFLVHTPFESVVTESESEPEDVVSARVERIQGAMGVPKVSVSAPAVSAAQTSSSSTMSSLDWLFEMSATTAPLGGKPAPPQSAAMAHPQPVHAASTAGAAPVPTASAPPSNKALAAERKQQEAKREQLKNTFFEKMKHRKAHDLVQVRGVVWVCALSVLLLTLLPPGNQSICDAVL